MVIEDSRERSLFVVLSAPTGHGHQYGAEFFEQLTAGKPGDAPVFVRDSGEGT